jgi:hypothetical protein
MKPYTEGNVPRASKTPPVLGSIAGGCRTLFVFFRTRKLLVSGAATTQIFSFVPSAARRSSAALALGGGDAWGARSGVQTLVSEEIRRIVADAVGDGMCIPVRASAARILRTYPDCGLEEREIIDEIVAAASAAGVATNDNLPPREPRRHGGEVTQFGALFAQSEAVRGAVDDMLPTTDAPVDPDEIIERLAEKIPNLDLTNTELRPSVVRIAKSAGKAVKQDEKSADRYEITKRRGSEVRRSV